MLVAETAAGATAVNLKDWLVTIPSIFLETTCIYLLASCGIAMGTAVLLILHDVIAHIWFFAGWLRETRVGEAVYHQDILGNCALRTGTGCIK